MLNASLWTFQGRWSMENPSQQVSAQMALTTGIENGPMQPITLWVHPYDRTLQRLTSSWIYWLSNSLVDGCKVFCWSQILSVLSVGDLVLPSGPSIDLPVFCPTWPHRPWGILHLETQKHWLNCVMMWYKISPGHREIRSFVLKFSSALIFSLSFLSLAA